MTPRRKNFYFIRHRTEAELEWLRPEQAGSLSLPTPLIVYSSPFDPLTVGDMRALFDARELAGERGTVLALLETYHTPYLLTPIERAAQLTYMPVDFLMEVEDPPALSALLIALSPTYWVTSPANKNKLPTVPKAIVRPSPIVTATFYSRVKQPNGDTV